MLWLRLIYDLVLMQNKGLYWNFPMIYVIQNQYLPICLILLMIFILVLVVRLQINLKFILVQLKSQVRRNISNENNVIKNRINVRNRLLIKQKKLLLNMLKKQSRLQNKNHYLKILTGKIWICMLIMWWCHCLGLLIHCLLVYHRLKVIKFYMIYNIIWPLPKMKWIVDLPDLTHYKNTLKELM